MLFWDEIILIKYNDFTLVMSVRMAERSWRRCVQVAVRYSGRGFESHVILWVRQLKIRVIFIKQFYQPMCCNMSRVRTVQTCSYCAPTFSDYFINSLAIFHISSNKYISFSFSTISYYSPHSLFCLSNSFFPPFSLLTWFLWLFFVSLLVHRFLSFISFNSSFHLIAPIIYLKLFVSFFACRILPPSLCYPLLTFARHPKPSLFVFIIYHNVSSH